MKYYIKVDSIQRRRWYSFCFLRRWQNRRRLNHAEYHNQLSTSVKIRYWANFVIIWTVNQNHGFFHRQYAWRNPWFFTKMKNIKKNPQFWLSKPLWNWTNSEGIFFESMYLENFISSQSVTLAIRSWGTEATWGERNDYLRDVIPVEQHDKCLR